MISLFTTILLFSPRGDADNRTSFLRVKDGKIVDGKGASVLLRGFNVSFKDFRGVLGERDILNIAGSGANSIRLVLDFRQFEPSPFAYDQESFSLLGSILDWCEKYGVYVILDMHLAPGIQNPHDFVVHREGSCEFWTKKEYQERFYVLWTDIAQRYAQRRIIAGYDLLNEGVPQDAAAYRAVIKKAAEAIRTRDKNHILIVEEAILPDGGKELLPLSDENVVYSIHFFYPPQFTFYTTTSERALTDYPGEMSTTGERIGEARTASVRGTGEWQKISVKASPPEGTQILMVNISSTENTGAVWFDDIALEKDGHRIDLPAPLVPNGSFETDYPGINWNTRGSGVAVTGKASRTGRCSLAFSRCLFTALAQSSPIEAKKGEYSLTGWVRSEEATGDNYLSLSWHKRRVLGRIDKNVLAGNLLYALKFRDRYHVPVHVGEFTVHANPSGESVLRYLKDFVDIMRSEGLHWSYWTYYSEYPGIGIYTGNHPRLARPEELELLTREMTRPHAGQKAR
jgi:hypothetical protein